MKIRVIDRIVLFLLALIALVIGVCAALNEFGINVLSIVTPLIPADIMALMTGTVMNIARIAAIAITILLSLYLFSVSFRRKKKPDPFTNSRPAPAKIQRSFQFTFSSFLLKISRNST